MLFTKAGVGTEPVSTTICADWAAIRWPVGRIVFFVEKLDDTIIGKFGVYSDYRTANVLIILSYLFFRSNNYYCRL